MRAIVRVAHNLSNALADLAESALRLQKRKAARLAARACAMVERRASKRAEPLALAGDAAIAFQQHAR